MVCAAGFTSIILIVIFPVLSIILTTKSGKYLCIFPSIGDLYGTMISSDPHSIIFGFLSNSIMILRSHSERNMMFDGFPRYFLGFMGWYLPLYATSYVWHKYNTHQDGAHIDVRLRV